MTRVRLKPEGEPSGPNASERRPNTNRSEDGSGTPSVGRRGREPGSLERGRERLGPIPNGDPLVQLHRTRGNQAVQRLVRKRVGRTVQPSLEVGAPDDKYEREAERVAERVMRTTDPTTVEHRAGDGTTAHGGEMCPRCRDRLQRGKSLDCADCERTLRREGRARTGGSRLQRSCAYGARAAGECVDCRERRERLRRTTTGAGRAGAPPIVDRALRSPGRPLAPETRGFMEDRFGHDFGRVRVHTDSRGAESAEAMEAQAYTVGTDIVFGAGQYAPKTASGRRLLVHELTHVVQQTGRQSGATGAQRAMIREHVSAPRIQGKWNLDRTSQEHQTIIQYTSGNGSASQYALGSEASTFGILYGNAKAWQTWGALRAEEGGRAQIAHWMTKHYVFTNDRQSDEFLQLGIAGQLGGNAKAEDLHYARSGAVVWGTITERTAANPTPPGQTLFQPISDGGVSAATLGDLGEIEADIPLGERGSVRITIPLKRVAEGAMAAYSDSTSVHRDVSSTVNEVDVFLGARVEADADIESSFFGLNPLISPDENTGLANTLFNLSWTSRPTPGAGVPGAGPAGEGDPAAAAKSNRIRVQLQHQRDDVVPSERVEENRNITVSEGHRAVDRLMGKPGRPVRQGCANAASSMKTTISNYPPHGVSSRGNVARKWCNDVHGYPRGIRLDLENLAGTNFTG